MPLRPGFSKNIEKYKHQIREFFKGEEVRTILVDYEDYDSKQLEKMTHVEVFGINEDNLTYILFDYKHRNPLNKQAKLINHNLSLYLLCYVNRLACLFKGFLCLCQVIYVKIISLFNTST